MTNRYMWHAAVRITIFITLIVWAMYEVMSDAKYPTYRAAGILGVATFIIVFPFLYVAYSKIKKFLYPTAKYKKDFVKLWFSILLFEPTKK